MTTPVSLKQLAESKDDNGVSKLTIFNVDPNSVHIEDGWNGRDENDDLAAYRQRLKAAMKAGAFVPPIDVEVVDGVPVVRDGHSRTLMARELVAEGFTYVLQARQIRGNDAEMRYHMLGSAAGRQLSPLEQGRQFLVLTRMGETVQQIADRLGQHRSTIENGLKMVEMPAAVQKLVAAGKVAPHQALKTVKAHGKGAADVLKAGIADAESKGKKKATGKHLNGPKVRGQTLPPAQGEKIASLVKMFDAPAMAAELTEGQARELVEQFRKAHPALAEMWAATETFRIGDISRTTPFETPAGTAILQRLAAVNILVSNLDRAVIAQLVVDARKLVGA